MPDSALDTDLLPRVLRDIAALIGLPATMTLVRVYGGTRLYVPKRFDQEHPLTKLLGHESALILIDHYGGDEHFDIPIATAHVRALRNGKIRRDRQMGATHRELARRNTMTERQIRNILQGEDDDSNSAQGRLL